MNCQIAGADPSRVGLELDRAGLVWGRERTGGSRIPALEQGRGKGSSRSWQSTQEASLWILLCLPIRSIPSKSFPQRSQTTLASPWTLFLCHSLILPHFARIPQRSQTTLASPWTLNTFHMPLIHTSPFRQDTTMVTSPTGQTMELYVVFQTLLWPGNLTKWVTKEWLSNCMDSYVIV